MMNNVQQQIAETNNDNNKFHMMKEVNKDKNDLAKLKMNKVNLKNYIDSNGLNAESESTKNNDYIN